MMEDATTTTTATKRRWRRKPSSLPAIGRAETTSTQHRPVYVQCLCVLVMLFVGLILAGLLGAGLRARQSSDVDIGALGNMLVSELCCQEEAIGSLSRHIAAHWQRNPQPRRLLFLAAGPSGTGKTLLGTALASALSGLHVASWRRLVGGQDIVGDDRRALHALATDLLSAVPRATTLLLLLEDVADYVGPTSELLQLLETAAVGADVRLMAVIAVSTPHLQQTADDTLQPLLLALPDARLLRFRPLRRVDLLQCVQLHAERRGVQRLPEQLLQRLLDQVPFDGEYAVNGCKPAVSKLNAMPEFQEMQSRNQ